MKTFAEYSEAAERTNHGEPYVGPMAYIALALSGEAGELANEVKKHYRDDYPAGLTSMTTLTTERRTKVLKEMGDVMWYMRRMAALLGSSLEEVAQMNIDKLAERHGG